MDTFEPAFGTDDIAATWDQLMAEAAAEDRSNEIKAAKQDAEVKLQAELIAQAEKVQQQVNAIINEKVRCCRRPAARPARPPAARQAHLRAQLPDQTADEVCHAAAAVLPRSSRWKLTRGQGKRSSRLRGSGQTISKRWVRALWCPARPRHGPSSRQALRRFAGCADALLRV